VPILGRLAESGAQSRLCRSDIERERDVILEEIKIDETTDVLVHELLRRHSGRASAGLADSGTTATVAGLDRESDGLPRYRFHAANMIFPRPAIRSRPLARRSRRSSRRWPARHAA